MSSLSIALADYFLRIYCKVFMLSIFFFLRFFRYTF